MFYRYVELHENALEAVLYILKTRVYAFGINQNEKNKALHTLLSLRLDAQPTVTY